MSIHVHEGHHRFFVESIKTPKWRAQREKTAQRGPNHRLAAARQASGLSQATLAGKVGVTQMAVSRWESSSVVPRQAEMRRQVAAVLQIEEDELWTTQ